MVQKQASSLPSQAFRGQLAAKKKKKKKQAIYWKSFAVGVMGAVQPIMAQDQTE